MKTISSHLKAILQGMTDAKPRVSYSSVCAFVGQVAEVKVTEVRQRLCKTVVPPRFNRSKPIKGRSHIYFNFKRR